MYYKVPKKLMSDIVQYLHKQPYEQVAVGLELLGKCEKVEEDIPDEDKSGDSQPQDV